MKKLVVLIISLVIAMMSTLNVFAFTFNPDNYTSVNEISEVQSENVRVDKVTERAKKRGDFFAQADLEIRDMGGGVIKGTALGYTRYPVDEAYITIYLDKFDAGANRWRQMGSYEAEFKAADYPEGIYTPGISAIFKDNEIGQKYRIRGVFAAVYQGEFEGFSPTTHPITIE